LARQHRPGRTGAVCRGALISLDNCVQAVWPDDWGRFTCGSSGLFSPDLSASQRDALAYFAIGICVV